MAVIDLIKESLQELQKINCENKISDKNSESRLIFPKYCVGKDKHKDTKRISEQEARFLFVRILENQKSFYYSVETPTKERYKDFSKRNKDSSENKPDIAGENEGRSASIDVTLYEKDDDNNNFCRKHLIEFKQGNVETCKKDFLKLLYDEDGLTNYYVNILDRDNIKKWRTLKSIIIDKYKKAIDELPKRVSNNKSTLSIILFNIKDGVIIFFKDIEKFFKENDAQSVIENFIHNKDQDLEI